MAPAACFAAAAPLAPLTRHRALSRAPPRARPRVLAQTRPRPRPPPPPPPPGPPALPATPTPSLPPGAVADVTYGPDAVAVSRAPPAGVGGVLYLQVPALAPHLAAEEAGLAHGRDGDGYVLAVSFGGGAPAEPWARGRFVRTKPYMREARERRRVYRGRYGTRGSTGLTAPVKPKRSCADGVFVWGAGKKRRVVAFGDGGLPVALDMASLVSKRVTALGACLTDAPELAALRGAEVSAAPVALRRAGAEERLSFPARTRAPSGRVTGVIVYEVDAAYTVQYATNRLPFPPAAHVAAFAATDAWYILFYYRAPALAPGVLGGLFGAAKAADGSGALDAGFGTRVMLVPAGGRVGGVGGVGGTSPAVLDVELADVLVTSCAAAVDAAGAVILDVATVAAADVGSLAELADAADGRASAPASTLRRYELAPGGDGGGDVSVSVVCLSENLCPSQPRLSFHRPTVAAAHPPPHSWQASRVLSAVVDSQSGRCGVASLDTVSGSASVWAAGDAADGALVSAPVVVGDGRYAAVLVSGGDGVDSRVVVLDVEDVAAGPVCEVALSEARLGACVGAVWCDAHLSWGEHGGKTATSSYELFDDKRWNDVNNGFSSFGFNQ
jgi:carotenoid cleavage dioxygenase-like enzyme